MKISNEVRVAVLALIAIFVFVYGFNFLKGNDLFKRTGTYYIVYDQVDGLAPPAPVTVNGVQVGSVIDVQILDNLDIWVELSLDRNLRLPKDVVADIYTISPLGEKGVRLLIESLCKNNCVQSGDTLQGNVTSFLTSFTGDISSTIDETKDAVSSALSAAMDSMNVKFSDESEAIGESFADMQSILKNLNRSSRKLDKLLDGSTDNIAKTIVNLEGATSNLKSTKEQLDRVLTGAETFTSDINSLNLKSKLNKTVDGIDGALSSTVEKVKSTLDKADKAISGVDDILAKVKDGDGSISQLMNDEAKLYNNVNEATLDLQLLMQDIRLNPKRYIRIFRAKSPNYEKPEDDPGRGE